MQPVYPSLSVPLYHHLHPNHEAYYPNSTLHLIVEMDLIVSVFYSTDPKQYPSVVPKNETTQPLSQLPIDSLQIELYHPNVVQALHESV